MSLQSFRVVDHSRVSLISRWFQTFVRLSLLLGVIVVPASTSKSQDATLVQPDFDPSTYQRVFVPKSNLDSLRLEKYRPIDLKAIDRIFASESDSNELRDTNTTSNIASLFLFAKLMGADIVSERSRVAWDDSPTVHRSKVRGKILSPWNQTFEPLVDEALSKSTPLRPKWLYDSQGQPTTYSTNGSEWFGWSARSLPESTPNQLKFKLRIPRSNEACLFLSVPSTAQIVDANVVARQCTWEECIARIPVSNDPQFTAERNVERNFGDTHWVIELSGQDQIVFSIALGSTGLTSGTAFKDSSSSFDRMISSQRVFHFVEPTLTRTQCEIEWIESSANSTPLRLKLPTACRIRRALINDREVGPIAQGNTLEIPVGLADSKLPITSMRSKALLEFITPIDIQPQGASSDLSQKRTLPTIAIDRSFVISGITSIQSHPTLEVIQLQFSQSRLSDNRENSSKRFDLHWQNNAPEVFASIRSVEVAPRFETVTRLSRDERGILATIRMQISSWNELKPLRLPISNQWKFVTAHAIPNTITVQAVSSETRQAVLQIDRGSTVDTEPMQLEIILRQANTSTHLIPDDDSPVIQFPDSTRRDFLLYEASDASGLDLSSTAVSYSVADEELTEWQRERLPRLGRYLNLRMTEGCIPYACFSNRSSMAVSATTRIENADKNIRVRHEFQIDNVDENSRLTIQATNLNWRWTIRTSAAETPRLLAPIGRTDSSNGSIFEFDLGLTNSDRKNNQCAIAAEAILDQKDEYQLVLPVVQNVEATTSQLELSSDLTISQASHKQSITVADSAAKLIDIGKLRFDDDRNLVIQRLPSVRRPWVRLAQMDAAIDDFGNERLLVRFELPSLDGPTLALRFNNHWKCSAAFASSDQSNWMPLAIEAEANRCTVRLNDALKPNRTLNAPVSVQIVFDRDELSTSPSLSSSSHRGLSRLHFQFPSIDLDYPVGNVKKRLWLHEALTVANRQDPNLSRASSLSDRISAYWPLWGWWQEMTCVLSDRVNETSDGLEEITTEIVPDRLAPNWMRSSLRLAAAENDHRLSDETQRAWIIEWSRHGSVWQLYAFMLASLLTPWLLLRFPWPVLFVAAVSIALGNWGGGDLGAMARGCLLGIALGSTIYAIYSVSVKAPNAHGRQRAHGHGSFAPWNDPATMLTVGSGEISASGLRGSHRGLAMLFLALILGPWQLAQAMPIWMDGNNASKQSSTSQSIVPVIIPIEEDGSIVDGKVWMPKEWVQQMENRNSNELESEVLVASAKHQFKADSRSFALVNAEQSVVQNYEIWVGQSAVGKRVSFPYSDKLKLMKFVVDGIESRFNRRPEELSWTPERAGRRMIQIESVVRVSVNEVDRSRPNVSWSLGLSVLPAANAVVEFETDSQLVVELDSRGRVSNPSVGRFTAMIGGQTDLKCTFIIPSTPNLRNFPLLTSDMPGTSSTEPPQMNTELLIDREQLIARTVIEFPKSNDANGEIEIESDNQWQPVGMIWGDAQVVDIRPGSTLDRRRYVLKWIVDKTINESASITPTTSTPLTTSATAPIANKKTIVATWHPIGSVGIRNVLFAECRDRRVRPGVLRFARTPGSVWMIDGVSTWTPAINKRERLEWPELTDKPIATALNIPISGGFGVLRLQTESRLDRAQINHQLHVRQQYTDLTSQVHLVSISTDSLVELSMPREYEVLRVSSRGAEIPFLQDENERECRLQLFLDRFNSDLADVTIQSRTRMRFVVPEANRQSIVYPRMAFVSGEVTSQSARMEIAHDWNLDTTIDSIRPEQALSGNQSFTWIDASTTSEPSRLEIVSRNEPWKGSIDLQFEAHDPSVRAHWKGIIKQTTRTRNDITIDVPTRWRIEEISGARLELKPSFNPLRNWLTVQLDQSDAPLPSDVQFNAILVCDDPAPADLELLSSSIQSLRSNTLSVAVTPISPIIDDSFDSNTAWSGEHAHALHRNIGLMGPSPDRTLLSSCFWLRSTEQNGKSTSLPTWMLPIGARCEAVYVNDKQVAFEIVDRRIEIRGWFTEPAVRVEFFTSDILNEQGKPLWIDLVPRLESVSTESILFEANGKGMNRLEFTSTIRSSQPSSRMSMSSDTMPKIISTLFGSLVLVLIAWFWPWSVPRFHSQPWWQLTIIGLLFWGVTGFIWPAIVLEAIAFYLVIDAYWIITSQSRRTAILGSR